MLELQIQVLSIWWQVSGRLRDTLSDARTDDRGEVTANTVMIVLLTVAALAAGGVIAAKITSNANKIPEP